MGVLHAQLCRPFIHEVCKGRERTRQLYSRCSRCIVAGGQQHPITEGTLRDNIVFHQPHRRPFDLNGVVVHGERGIQVAALQTEQGCHNFGGACHGEMFVCVLGEEHFSGGGFHDNASLCRDGRQFHSSGGTLPDRTADNRNSRDNRQQKTEQAFAHRASSFLVG